MATIATPKAAAIKARPTRPELAQAGALLGLIAVVAVPAGIDATYIAQDGLVGIAAAGMAALLAIALLQMLGILGGR